MIIFFLFGVHEEFWIKQITGDCKIVIESCSKRLYFAFTGFFLLQIAIAAMSLDNTK